MNMRTDRRSRPSSTRSPRLLSSVIGKWKWQPQSFNAHFTTQTLNKVKRDERGLFNVRACEVGLGGSRPSLSPGITTWMTIWLSMPRVVFFSKFWVQWNAALILRTRFLFYFYFFISLSRPCDHSVITQIEFGTLWKDLTLRFGNNGQNNLHLVRTYLQLSMQHNLTHEFNSNQGYTGWGHSLHKYEWVPALKQ